MNTSEIMSAMIFGDGGASKVEELSTDGGSTDAGKVLVVGDNGKIAASDLTVGEGEVAIDKTFKVAGAAADSKAVGDAITSLNGSLDTLEEDVITNLFKTDNVDFATETTYNYIIASSTGQWSGSGARYCYIISVPDGAKKVTITANSTVNATYAFLKDNKHVAQTTPSYCDGTSRTSITKGTTETLSIPSDCNYMYIYKSYNDLVGTPSLMEFEIPFDIGAMRDVVNANTAYVAQSKAVPSQIFNINLSNADEYGDISSYNAECITTNGYVPEEGWGNRVVINKYVVCDDIRYRANISLNVANTGICVLGTQSLAGALGNHATLVKFDFGNAVVSFLTGSDSAGGGNIDGKTIPEYVYDSFSLENLSGTEYRIEIGRVKRCIYAKVYNLTAATLCGEKTLTIYETSSGYGGKAGAMYDIPNFGVLSGEVTFRRVSASVPTGVFAAFLGNSITEGSGVAWTDAWANKGILYLGSGINCGRGSGDIDEVLKCAYNILPAVKPKYVIVTIGTNGTPTLVKFYELIAQIRLIGAIPIINRIPMNTKSGSGSTAEVNAIVDMLGVDGARFDVATAVNNDPAQGQNASLFNADRLHPNAEGGIALYNQFIADLGWIKPDTN